MPTVSVIIPSYNSAHYLSQAVDSVLAQTHQDLDVIIMDDGSTDDTKAVAHRYGASVRYFYQSNQGVARARNHAVEESRGQYVAFLDADDVWLPTKLERQLEALEQTPGAGACFCARLLVDENLQPMWPEKIQRRHGILEDLLFIGNFVGGPSAVMVDREVLSQTGGFDPEMSMCADWDLWLRVAVTTEFVCVPEPLTAYRQHITSMSHNAPLFEDDSIRTLEKGFAMSGVSEALRQRQRSAFARNYTALAGCYFQARSYGHFARCAIRAVWLDQRQLHYIAGFPWRVASRWFHPQVREAV